MNIHVLPLLCPDCRQPLEGLNHDRIFFCSGCSQGVEAVEGRWRRHPLFTPGAKKELSSGVVLRFFPFWELSLSAQAAPQNRTQENACRLLQELTTVWVCGFTIIRASYFGDPGLAYTEKRVKLDPLPPPSSSLRLAGCTRTAEEAGRYAELFISLILDKKADITGLHLNVTIHSARLWAIPFADSGEEVHDLILALSLPAFVLDDLEALRQKDR